MMVLSYAATPREERTWILLIDISTLYSNDRTSDDEPVHVEFPP